MAALKIEQTENGKVWVSLTRFGDAELARLKQIPGARWNPERKQWSFPESPATRKALAEMVALPPAPPPQMLAVKPKQPGTPSNKPRHRYTAGEDKPLTTNSPHPLIKKLDDELVLRGMAYGTRTLALADTQVPGRVTDSTCEIISIGCPRRKLRPRTRRLNRFAHIWSNSRPAGACRQGIVVKRAPR